MTVISVDSDRQYEVSIGINWVEELGRISGNFQRVLIVIPQSLSQLFHIENVIAKLPSCLIFETTDGESQKNSQTLTKIWEKLGKENFTRSDAIVAIGGGATTDLAGFAAASWLRGIEWFAVPTTLAGMVDASVGGKTGINTDAGKNLVGAFYSPSSVLMDPTFLHSLSDRDFAAGMAEVIKTGFIEDGEILSLISSASTPATIREIAPLLIEKSVAVKARVVSADFKEGKLREILNYGHTLGHAIEKHANYQMRHGEAIAIGLVFAAELSKELCGLEAASVELHRQLLSRFDLPITYSTQAWPQLLDLMRSDKKSRGSRLRFVGISRIGQPDWIETVSDQLLEQVYGRIST